MSNEPEDESKDYQDERTRPADDDPGSPELDDPSEEELELARAVINYGEVEPGTNKPPDEATADPETERAWEESLRDDVTARRMPIDIDAVKEFLQACRSAGVSYGSKIGNKVPFHGARPGKDFKFVDCSGFVREAIWRATTPHLNFIDGSVRQHDWIRGEGFERSSVADAKGRDGIVRIAFLKPQDSPKRIGHVAIVHNASTIESHSGIGPNSRPWNGTSWQAKAFVYVLHRP